jgi:integrase
LALFDLAIDSKLRACDLTKLRVRDIAHGALVSSRAIVMQQKTQRPVQFEITEQTRAALETWIQEAQLRGSVTCSSLSLLLLYVGSLPARLNLL